MRIEIDNCIDGTMVLRFVGGGPLDRKQYCTVRAAILAAKNADILTEDILEQILKSRLPLHEQEVFWGAF